MAFTGNTACDSFQLGGFTGRFDFRTDALYIALYTNEASLDATTSAYTAVGEVVAPGYTAGGQLLTVSTQPVVQNGVAYVSFANAVWSGSFTARGALIYKPGDNGAICVLDFGSDKTSTATFTVQFPAATSTSAIIRIS
jgi:hypothetical protein